MITGISGAGKTTLGKKIKNKIELHYGLTLLINGDDLRNIFKLEGYSYNERLNIGYMYLNFLKLITSQNINVIFTVVGLFDKLRKQNRKLFKITMRSLLMRILTKLLK